MKKRKAGGELIPSEVQAIIADPDPYLFDGGRSLKDYWIDTTAGEGTICFLHEGREIDWLISNGDLANALRTRLIELGVEVRST